MQKFMNRLAAMALIGMTMAGTFGCAYGAMATASDGTVYVARNDLILFGLLRKVFICKPSGANLACTEAVAAP